MNNFAGAVSVTNEADLLLRFCNIPQPKPRAGRVAIAYQYPAGYPLHYRPGRLLRLQLSVSNDPAIPLGTETTENYTEQKTSKSEQIIQGNISPGFSVLRIK